MAKLGSPRKYDEEMVLIPYKVTKEHRQNFKVKCAIENVTMNDVIDTLVKMYLNDEIELEM